MPTIAIVGLHFHPPAKAIIQVLPQGAELLLIREPENSYDANAIQVKVPSSAFPEEHFSTLVALAVGHGFSEEELKSEENSPWLLGFIPKGLAAEFAPVMDRNDCAELPGTLSFSPKGAPQVEWEFPENWTREGDEPELEPQNGEE